jgi:hypothetical protein
MHALALRTVLLIRTIDEGDKTGEVLSLAERAAATKAASTQSGAIPNTLSGSTLPPAAERLLVRRAELLLDKLQTRAPVIGSVLDLTGGASWLAAALFALAFLLGLSTAALEGRDRIDLLSFPLLGLIGWNLVVYAALFVGWLARRGRGAPPSTLPRWYARWIRERADSLLRHASRFNAPLTEAMQRFATEWASIAQPLALLRAKRVFHLSASAVALGLVAGLYVRGLVLHYEAGWNSTFLRAIQVRSVFGLLYGPAAALSGIALPTIEQVEAMRWNEAEGGAPAASFIHLIALTAFLYIVLPRFVLAMASTVSLWRALQNPRLPEGFMPYARSILRETGRVTQLTTSAVTYGYTPSRDALAGLNALLSDALRGEVKVEVSVSVAYGEEDGFAKRMRGSPLLDASCHVLLMSLSSTPESENHGAMIEAMQGALGRKNGGLLLVVDASSYAARMGDDETLASRIAERSRTWRDFAAARNQPAYVVDLSRLRPGDPPDPAAREALERAMSQ